MRRFSIRALLILGLMAVFASPLARAGTDAEIRAAIDDTLLQRHPTDTPDWWRRLGPSTPKVIISMYETTSHIGHRVKLLQGLAAFDTPEAVEFLKKQAQATPDDVIRNVSVKGVGAAGGAKETEFLSRYLHHEDPQTRLAAAEALSRFDDARARALVDQFKREEKTPWVVARLSGQTPGATGTLKPVTTSEDRLSPELAGEWTGLWVAPKKGQKKGVSGEDFILRLRSEGASELKGDAVLSSPRTGKARMGSAERITGKSQAISGVLVFKAQGKEPAVEFVFEARLESEADAPMLVLRVRKLGVWAILKRSP